MIYRKTPSQPGRLILRIVATTGAGTLLGAVACGPSVNECGGVCGGVANPGSGAVASGSTGSASGAASTGYEGLMGTAGSASGGVGAGTGYEWAGSLTTSIPP
jgi:hypothetical protein